MVLRNSALGGFTYIWQSSWLGVIAKIYEDWRNANSLFQWCFRCRHCPRILRSLFSGNALYNPLKCKHLNLLCKLVSETSTGSWFAACRLMSYRNCHFRQNSWVSCSFLSLIYRLPQMLGSCSSHLSTPKEYFYSTMVTLSHHFQMFQNLM